MTFLARMIAVVLAVAVAASCGDGGGQGFVPLAEREKPEVTIPDRQPPDKLQVEDLMEGDGEVATKDHAVTVHYVGVAWSTGEQFDSSWDRGQPITFPLSGVIEGWTEGISGMRVGGRRRLVIPPDQAYGTEPPPGSGIKVNETLVFVVDLFEVGPAPQQQMPPQPQPTPPPEQQQGPPAP